VISANPASELLKFMDPQHPHDGEMGMGHPFASVLLGFSVMGNDALWWDG
jgi:hypothetical protein